MPRLAFLAALLLALPADAAPVRTPHVEAELVAERTAFVPGEPLVVALRLAMIPGWHTYWQNPGDSGEPTRLTWRLPAGFEASEIYWPYPRRLPAGPLLNYGYEREVLLLARITPPRDLASGTPVTLAAKATWLVCSKDHCIPEDGELALTLPVARESSEDPRWAKPIAASRASLPAPPGALAGWTLAASGEAGGATLALAPPSDLALRELQFFPFEQGKIEPAAAQTLVRTGDGYRLKLASAAQPVGEFTRLSGVLVSAQGFGAATPARAVTIDVPIAGSVTPALAPPVRAPAASELGPGLGLALVFAFAGGLILNLMPCVLPVLSIKVLGFAGPGAGERRTRRRHGLVYAAGVLASFWLLAALLLGLRALGAELGWGFQLQSPVAVAALALFFFALGLNLSGVFEVGTLLPDRVAGWRAANPSVDWFLSGVLAVAIASPCTAPLMGAALGYAIGESGWRAFAVFTALGVGMALPYVLLAWFPGWLKRVPKPGPWMVRLKQALAFPLYGTVVWLAWVLGEQAGLTAVVWLLAALVAVAAAGWLASLPRLRLAAAVLAAAAVVAALPAARTAPPAPVVDAVWQPFSADKVATLAAMGKPVFVDFTAAWCVTCQVNKRLVLGRGDVLAAFRARGVELVRADWTRRDDDITRALAALGRNGVPVYVLYKPGQAPVLLPEVLTRERLLAALAG
jgi:thiol:disulfide interchange protein DsbD